MNLFQRFMTDQSGAAAIEYGLIAVLISVAIIPALGVVGIQLSDTFTKIASALHTGSTGGSI